MCTFCVSVCECGLNRPGPKHAPLDTEKRLPIRSMACGGQETHGKGKSKKRYIKIINIPDTVKIEDNKREKWGESMKKIKENIIRKQKR